MNKKQAARGRTIPRVAATVGPPAYPQPVGPVRKVFILLDIQSSFGVGGDASHITRTSIPEEERKVKGLSCVFRKIAVGPIELRKRAPDLL